MVSTSSTFIPYFFLTRNISFYCRASRSDGRSQCKSNRILLSLVAVFVLTTVILAVGLSLVLTNRTGDILPNSESNGVQVLNNGDRVTEFSATNKRVLILTKAEQHKLEEQLKIVEGVKYEVYPDSLGKLTFGIGHLITKKDPEYGKQVGTKVSEKRVKEAFGVDLQIVLKEVYAWSSDCNTWPSEVKQIIANMMFNLGRNRMNKFAKLKAAVQAREWKTAANEMADSRWARQVKDRATRLIDRMRNVVSINKQNASFNESRAKKTRTAT